MVYTYVQYIKNKLQYTMSKSFDASYSTISKEIEYTSKEGKDTSTEKRKDTHIKIEYTPGLIDSFVAVNLVS